MKKPIDGHEIKCTDCNGTGVATYYSNFGEEPDFDECRGCNGSGVNWLYSGGAIAKYYGGPLIGREPAA